jgi:hypothetical protein
MSLHPDPSAATMIAALAKILVAHVRSKRITGRRR